MTSLRNTKSRRQTMVDSDNDSPKAMLCMSMQPGVVVRGDQSIKGLDSTLTQCAKLPDPRQEKIDVVANAKVPLWKTIQTTAHADREREESTFIKSKIKHELERESTFSDIEQFEYSHGMRLAGSPRRHRLEQLHTLYQSVNRPTMRELNLDPKTESKLERWKHEAKRAHSADRMYRSSRLTQNSSPSQFGVNTRRSAAPSQCDGSGSFQGSRGYQTADSEVGFSLVFPLNFSFLFVWFGENIYLSLYCIEDVIS
eukprot:TRINITY_DN1559_c0_g1_i8.p1 TRINITY_DN1559_c0_g1~~TRINITY_DN1559_c0_g1_i8.p1  ORF type:complete len:255 (+),score=39.83 TRINITY_DN1559_c0_g1_i8:61-825(+)